MDFCEWAFDIVNRSHGFYLIFMIEIKIKACYDKIDVSIFFPLIMRGSIFFLPTKSHNNLYLLGIYFL